MGNQSFFQLGQNDPNNSGWYDPGDLTKKQGLANYLSLQLGQNQGKINQTQSRTNQERGDLQSKYGDLYSGSSGLRDVRLPSDESGLLDSLTQQVQSNNSPESMANYSRGVMTPLRGAFDVARSKAGNRVARTGNSAGYGSMLSELAREEGRQSSQAGYDIGNEQYKRNTDTTNALTGLANTRFSRNDTAYNKASDEKMAGLNGLAQMYGVDLNTLSQLQTQQQNIFSGGNSIESRRKGKLGDLAAGMGIGQQGVGIMTGLNNMYPSMMH